ncbi:MAG TPA: M67 family metallopeptidase [Tepidiformaceae bacterium]|nr:M67 family metallopeptidase [Tepidiformaceae bacterium]
MAAAIRLRREHVDSMIDHARRDAPIECCGLLAARDGEVVSLHPAKNRENSPYRFDIDPLETKKLLETIEASDAELAGFYHSHTGSPAVPSPTDIRMMGPLFGPPYVHFVVGLEDPGSPSVRAWYIEDGDKSEQTYDLID